MATTLTGTDSMEALINAIQDALNDKENNIDIEIEPDGVRIKNIKIAHEAITKNEVQDSWGELTEA